VESIIVSTKRQQQQPETNVHVAHTHISVLSIDPVRRQMLSALMHDVDHPAVSNFHLVKGKLEENSRKAQGILDDHKHTSTATNGEQNSFHRAGRGALDGKLISRCLLHRYIDTPARLVGAV
jgi:hypothetical protein